MAKYAKGGKSGIEKARSVTRRGGAGKTPNTIKATKKSKSGRSSRSY